MVGCRSLKSISIVLVCVVLLAACGPKTYAPEPGSLLTGTISMDTAKTASISLQVSDDGNSIEMISLSFTELKCEGFSAGSSMTSISTIVPIEDGSIVIKSDDFGEISGKFVSAKKVEGTAHMAFYNGQAECGTWDWSAEVQ